MCYVFDRFRKTFTGVRDSYEIHGGKKVSAVMKICPRVSFEGNVGSDLDEA